MNEVVAFTKDVVRQIPAADLILLAGLVTTGVHGLIKRYKELGKVANIITSFILPVAGSVLPVLVAQNSVLSTYPKVYAVAQMMYYAYNGLKTGVTWLQLGQQTAAQSNMTTQSSPVLPEETQF